MSKLSDNIEHVIVLMLENRSFDSMLGTLYPSGPKFEGLTGQESNTSNQHGRHPVWNSNSTEPQAMSIPDPDPGESWQSMNRQLFGGEEGPADAGQRATMSGFVEDYLKQHLLRPGHYDPNSVMHYYTPEQLPVISTLARQYAVCDQWFASAPCQTWPNRFFLHCATAAGYENNSPVHFPYLMDTVFNRMEDAGKTWRIYFHDFPQALTLSRLWPHVEHFRFFDEFIEDCKNDQLPAYAFLEPRYFPDVMLPNDQHPPHHVGMGEELIAEVYNAVRASPAWDKTLLIIIYDEHGGCYDHVAPPAAVAPEDKLSTPFAFDRYGVRVPAVIVSPYITPGTILRVADYNTLPHRGPPYPYDHTSVFATLRQCFDLGGPLTRRDAVAPDLEQVLNSDSPDNNQLDQIKALAYPMTQAQVDAALAAPLNDFQKALHHAAHHLPALAQIDEASGIVNHIEQHLKNIVNGALDDLPEHNTAATALPYMKKMLASCLRH